MDVRKKSLGHTTDMINEGYTHIDLETIKRNYEKVPDIDWQDVMWPLKKLKDALSKRHEKADYL